jgi:hypothetical protein
MLKVDPKTFLALTPSVKRALFWLLLLASFPCYDGRWKKGVFIKITVFFLFSGLYGYIA